MVRYLEDVARQEPLLALVIDVITDLAPEWIQGEVVVRCPAGERKSVAQGDGFCWGERDLEGHDR
jgi:hypothetical protein